MSAPDSGGSPSASANGTLSADSTSAAATRVSARKHRVAPAKPADNSQLTFDAFVDGERKKSARRAKAKPKMAETWGEMLQAWPKCTILIVANEFFQKFASLGTVLTMYLLNGLRFTENQTTIFFNIYQVFGGIVPLLGSILADGYIGKFSTILYASILYGIGKIVMASASVMNPSSVIHPWMDIAGIAIITIGMGGIIPCVASFGGDQFEPHQERMISVFFSIFYASINAGALISTFLLPILRSQSCLDQDSCYPLSFGFSAVVMIIAAVLFVVGSRSYKKTPPEGNVFADVWRTGRQALRNRSKVVVKNKAHWLDYYLDTHDCMHSEKCLQLRKRKRDPTLCERKRFLDDIKSLLRILVMYLPIPMFWALYDQQYSVWLIQSIQMDCRLWGDVLLLPDQMQIVNPVLILVFIALFESVVYPLVSKLCKLTPLRKMVAGGVVASFAFVVSAFVQLKVNTTLPDLPSGPYAFVSVMNTFDNCDVNVTLQAPFTSRFVTSNTSLVNNKLTGQLELFTVPAGASTWSIAYNGSGCSPDAQRVWDLPASVTYSFDSGQVYYIYVGRMGAFAAQTDTQKPLGGTGEFSLSVALALSNLTYGANFALCRNDTDGTDEAHPCDPRRGEDFYFYESSYDEGRSSDLAAMANYSRASTATYSEQQATVYKFKPVRPGSWRLFYLYNTPRSIGQKTMSKEQVNVSYTGIDLKIEGQGGVYVLSLTGDAATPERRVLRVVPDNSVSILWQIPQIAIITCAEILFSITGYAFAYSESAASMKALVQALWFLTVAGGDLLIVGIALLNFKNMALQALMCAVAMLVVISIFALLAIFYYEYRAPDDYPDEHHGKNSSSSSAKWTSSTSLGALDADGEDCFVVPLKRSSVRLMYGSMERRRRESVASVGMENQSMCRDV